MAMGWRGIERTGEAFSRGGDRNALVWNGEDGRGKERSSLQNWTRWERIGEDWSGQGIEWTGADG
jgi:hypothetical protein